LRLLAEFNAEIVHTTFPTDEDARFRAAFAAWEKESAAG
jgi:hypothetical protein